MIRNSRAVFDATERPAVVDVQEEPKNVKREVASSMNEVEPSRCDQFAASVSNEHSGHLFQDSTERVSGVTLLAWVRPIDRNLGRRPWTVVFQVGEELSLDLRPKTVSHSTDDVREFCHLAQARSVKTLRARRA